MSIRQTCLPWGFGHASHLLIDRHRNLRIFFDLYSNEVNGIMHTYQHNHFRSCFFIILLLLLTFLLTSVNQFCSPENNTTTGTSTSIPDPEIVLTSPHQGDILYTGKPYSMSWTAENIDRFDMVIRRYDGGSDMVGNLAASAGTASWVASGDLTDSAYVQFWNLDKGLDLDSSTTFSIGGLKLNWCGYLQVPISSIRPIRWENLHVAQVDIELSRDGNWQNGDGSDVEILASALDASVTEFLWTVTHPETESALIRIHDTSDVEIQSVSLPLVLYGLKIMEPHGGEIWHPGTIQNISWLANSEISFVDLELSRDGTWTSPETIASSLPASDGSYQWTVTGPASQTCYIRVTNTGAIIDTQDTPFTITQLDVTSPNGGESLDMGGSWPITWDSQYLSTVQIELSRDGNWNNGDGSNVEILAEGVDSSLGSWTWNSISGTVTDNALVRITDESLTQIQDVSDGVFSIHGIELTAPAGGNTYVCGALANISWISGGIDNVRVELSRDGNWNNGDGSDVEVLSASTPDDGSFDWQVSGPSQTATALIRVMDAANTAFLDVMASPFGIKGFVPISLTATQVENSTLAWGDYDSDKDLDLIFAGEDGSSNRYTRMLRNNGNGTFTEINPGLKDIEIPELVWGDYANDADIDLILEGYAGTAITNIYRNDSGTFTDSGASFQVISGVVQFNRWIDFNNDGKLDLFQAENDCTKLFKNVGTTTFVETSHNLPTFILSGEWGDFNQDGMQDLFVEETGIGGGTEGSYLNTGTTTFTIIPDSGFLDRIAMGDYDSDGDLDYMGVIHGTSSNSYLYKNDGNGNFSQARAFHEFDYGELDWGDIDNDGDLDLVICGRYSDQECLRILRNDGSDNFTEVEFTNDTGALGALKLADFDKDGHLDFALTGYDINSNPYLKIFRNEGFGPANTAPSAPSSFSTSVSGSGPYTVTFQWNDSSDTITPTKGLSYNLRIGTTSGGNQVMSGMAAADGTRYLTGRGPIQPAKTGNNKWIIRDLPAGTYYWSVQAIDGGYMASAWSSEQTLVLP